MSEEIERLKKYNDETTSDFGIMMPTLETFDTKVLMATTLWPQINKSGGIDYLLGKGVGAELAIRGEVLGRDKNPVSFPYRSHSDFEIYDCIGYFKIPEANEFYQVFGAQEYYPKDGTKGLHGMDPTMMDSTYETVTYNGHIYLVPELEILFLDKYLKQESTPREEGCDALLLLQAYPLDIDRINELYDKYVASIELAIFDERMKGAYDIQVRNIPNNLLNSLKIELEEYGVEPTLRNINIFMNEKINEFRSMKKPPTVVNGVSLNICPKEIVLVQKEDGTIDISEENKEEIKSLIGVAKRKKREDYKELKQEINDHYDRIYPGKRNTNGEVRST